MAGPNAVETARQHARTRLAAISDTPDLEARWILQHVLEVDDGWLVVHARDALATTSAGAIDRLVERRLAGTPLAQLLGRAGFWTLDLAITDAVLVPRPDTETLVEAALEHVDPGPARIADLGTGSGAIALALASERPDWAIVATDTSAAALACARANAARLGLARIRFARGRWFAPLPAVRFDAIVSNPPYISPDDPHLADLVFEPSHALVAGEHGLADLAELVAQAADHLADNGWLMLEHGASQGQAVRTLFRAADFDAIETRRDLGGRERVTLGRRRR